MKYVWKYINTGGEKVHLAAVLEQISISRWNLHGGVTHGGSGKTV